MDRSLPSRGAWIEITKMPGRPSGSAGRSPHGERGLKFGHAAQLRDDVPRRSPHGERGLKFDHILQSYPETSVAPLTGSVD